MENINLHMEEALTDGAVSDEKADHCVEGIIIDLKNLNIHTLFLGNEL